MTEHTPTPWKVDGEDLRAMVRGDDLTIVAVRHRLPGIVNVANAAFIVKAVNSHQPLVDTIKTIAEWRNINIAGEHEHALRDIIRSIVDCATAAMERVT